MPSRVAAKAAARLLPLKRQCCARLRAKAESRVHSRTSPDQSLLVPPLHNVERGTLKDSLTVAGGEDAEGGAGGDVPHSVPLQKRLS